MKKEVLALEAEEISIDMVINDALEKSSVTDAIIKNLKEKYSSLTINGQSDREGYDAVVEARKECKGWRVLASKVCKKGREKAVAEQKAWVKKEGEVVGKISEIEDYLEKQETDWENEKERIKQEKKRLQDEAFILRQAELNRMGVAYNAGNFELGEVSFDSGTIKESDNEIWENSILPKYHEQYEKIEAIKLEQQRIQAEMEAEVQKQREEFEAQQKAFKDQQELFQKQQTELNRQKEDHERQQRLDQEQKDREARQRREEVINKRIDQLISLGMTYSHQYSAYLYKDVNIDVMTELKLWNEKEWDDTIAKITPVIAERKKAEEEKQAAKIAEDIRLAKEQAAQQEREKIAEEQRQAEIKRQQGEQRKAEELALANDKTKWAAFIKNIEAITHSEMKSPKYKRMQGIAKEKLEEIIQL